MPLTRREIKKETQSSESSLSRLSISRGENSGYSHTPKEVKDSSTRTGLGAFGWVFEQTVEEEPKETEDSDESDITDTEESDEEDDNERVQVEVDDGAGEKRVETQRDLRPMSEDEKAEMMSGPEEEIYFCYLAINFDQTQKINTHIGKSRNPAEKVDLLNEINRTSNRTSKKPKPIWYLSLIIGKFNSKNEAIEFAESWKQQSRGIVSRRKFGMKMATMFQKTCWDNDLKV